MAVSIRDDELLRRVSIGLNDWIPLERRRSYVDDGVSVREMQRLVGGFRPYEEESFDILRWLQGPMNSIRFDGEDGFPSFDGLERHVPSFLLFQGPVPDTRRPCLGIVGTRLADYEGLGMAFELGLGAGLGDVYVASGLAEGIDQAAMRGCIAANGACIGVLACGHEVEYPSLTYRLRESVVGCGGCIVSRFPPKTPSYKSNFVSRNMVIASYSSSLVVVQAPSKSGSLITCDYAVSMGKDVLVSRAGVICNDAEGLHCGLAPCRAGSQALANDGAPVVSSSCECLDISRNVVVKQLGHAYGSREVSFADGLCESSEGRLFRFGDRVYGAYRQ